MLVSDGTGIGYKAEEGKYKSHLVDSSLIDTLHNINLSSDRPCIRRHPESRPLRASPRKMDRIKLSNSRRRRRYPWKVSRKKEKKQNQTFRAKDVPSKQVRLPVRNDVMITILTTQTVPTS